MPQYFRFTIQSEGRMLATSFNNSMLSIAKFNVRCRLGEIAFILCDFFFSFSVVELAVYVGRRLCRCVGRRRIDRGARVQQRSFAAGQAFFIGGYESAYAYGAKANGNFLPSQTAASSIIDRLFLNARSSQCRRRASSIMST